MSVPRTPRVVPSVLLLALALTAGGGCASDDDGHGSGPAGALSLEPVAGDGQVGEAGTMVGYPLVVRVRSSSGRAIPNASVTWQASGGGLVLPRLSRTNGEGIASGYWLLDAQVGTQSATATVPRAAGTVRFQARAELVSEPTFEGTRRLGLDTYEGSGQVVHPDVTGTPLGWSASRRHLAITPYPYGNAHFENPSLFTGDDGERWRIPEGLTNPVVRPAPGSYLSDPDHLWVPETRELWLYYRQVTSDNVILLTRSGDGVRWELPVEVLRAPNHRAVSPSVVRREPRDWMMWTVNAGPIGCGASSTTVELRRSEDGVVWSAPTAVALAQPGVFVWHIDVQWVASRNEFWALYNAKAPGSCNTAALYLATSPDGERWTTYPSPVLHRADFPAFEDVVYRASFEYNPASDVVTLWLSGARWDGTGFAWSAAVQRRLRERLFADVQARPAATLESARAAAAERRPGVPLLDAETAP